MPSRSTLVIVTPAVAEANNGNWRTARRWQELLGDEYIVRVTQAWPDGDVAHDHVMLVLHARRSADAIAAWAQAHPGRGLGVVLTGTDLYQDIAFDTAAQRSLQVAQRLVVLQECGVEALPADLRSKARVIFQSTPALPPLPKPSGHLQAVMVGHLRAVKTPQTLFEAARLLREHSDIRILHIGDGAAEPALALAARETAASCPGYRWLGALPHDQTLQQIRQAHVLIHTSVLEGGAHAILEAVRCGTPVLASKVPGNVGMLGADYAGYFPHADAAALAQLLLACRQELVNVHADGLLARLRAQCALRAPLFDSRAERQALLNLLHELETAP